jgi:predicted RNase H-like HicB family nuclease
MFYLCGKEFYKMKRTYNIIIEEGIDGYLISSVVELPGCHTQAKTYDELVSRTREAIELYVDETDEIEVGNRFVGFQQISL